jgi:hypothetical protein
MRIDAWIVTRRETIQYISGVKIPATGLRVESTGMPEEHCDVPMLCCAVLCCAVLCCAVLCCAVLCCAVLCCAVHGCDHKAVPKADNRLQN